MQTVLTVCAPTVTCVVIAQLYVLGLTTDVAAQTVQFYVKLADVAQNAYIYVTNVRAFAKNVEKCARIASIAKTVA